LETVFGSASGGILRINTDIIIPSGKEITLENITFEFGPQGRIIVQRGGSLRFAGSLNTPVILRGLCNSVWQGIQAEGPGWGNQRQTAPIINYGKIYDLANTQYAIQDAIIGIAGMRLPLIDVNAITFQIEDALNLYVVNGGTADFMPNLTSVFLKTYTNSATAQSTSGGIVHLTQGGLLEGNFQGINLSWFDNLNNASGSVPFISQCELTKFWGASLPFPFNTAPLSPDAILPETGIYCESYRYLPVYNNNYFFGLKYGIRTFECQLLKIGSPATNGGNTVENCKVGISVSNSVLSTSLTEAISIYGNTLSGNRIGIQSAGSAVYITNNSISGSNAVYTDASGAITGVQMGVFLQGADFTVKYNQIHHLIIGIGLLNNEQDIDLIEENQFTATLVGGWSLGDNDGAYFHCNQFNGYFYALLLQDYFVTPGLTLNPGIFGDQGMCSGFPTDDPADNAFVDGFTDIRSTIADAFIYYHRLGAGFVPNPIVMDVAGSVIPNLCDPSVSFPDIANCDTWQTIPDGVIGGMLDERTINKTLLQKIRFYLETEHDTLAALGLLYGVNTDMALRLQVREAFSRSDYELADSLRSLLPDTRLNDYYFRQLYDLNRNLQQTGRTPLQLTPTETGLLHTIAQSQTNMAYSAHSLLYLAHGEEYQQNLPPLPDELMTANWQMYINYKQAGLVTNSETHISILPNPSQNEVSIHFQTTNLQPQELLFFDLTGKLRFKQILSSAGTYQLNTIDWSDGMYFYRLIQNGYVTSAGKLIILK
ncbi:hypothetical protein BVG80_00030, partial [Sphingobacteriales bacterium TSM_CSM]